MARAELLGRDQSISQGFPQAALDGLETALDHLRPYTLAPGWRLTMPKYLFLLHQRLGANDELSPDEMQEIVAKHREWARGLKESGAYMASDLLAKDGRTLKRPRQQLQVSDGPYVESKEIIVGFYLVEASDYDHAVELAAECPAIGLGTLEIREIRPR
jgi:hypothetical protein